MVSIEGSQDDPLGARGLGGPRPAGGDRHHEASQDEGPRRVVRRPDASLVLSVVPLLLLLVPAWGIVRAAALLAGRAHPALEIIVPVLWIAAGAAPFIRPLQRWLLRTLFRVRQPTPAELAQLEPAWAEIVEGAAIKPAEYVLAVDDSPQLNAFAVGGHVVTVTRTALDALPRPELVGVLAHELGHHLGLHPLALWLGFWLSLPIIAVEYIATLLFRITTFISAYLDDLGYSWASLVGFLAALPLLLFAYLLHAIVWVSRLLTTWIGRLAEYRADRTAVELGFGRELAAALERFVQIGAQPETTATVADRLWSTHPPLSKRLARINRARSAPRT